MIYRILFLVLFSCHLSFSQTIELAAGFSRNHYSTENSYKFGDFANSNLGYHVFLGVGDIGYGLKASKGITARFTIGVTTSEGEFQNTYGGQAGQNKHNGDAHKSVLTIGVYPLNMTLYKNFQLNFGAQYLRVISSDVTGTSRGFGVLESVLIPFNDSTEKILAENQIGLSLRLAYNVKLTEDIFLTPQYSYYLGLTNEFRRIFNVTSIQNHFWGIGIQKKF